MKLSKVQELLNAKVYTGQEMMDTLEVTQACGSDLMSDVLAFVKEQGLLLTGLQNLQVVRTAEMMDMQAIVFVRGKEPDAAMIQTAAAKDLVLLNTEYPMLTGSAVISAGGLGGGKSGVLEGYGEGA